MMLSSRYEFIAPIGEGNYGTLYRGVDHDAADPAHRLIAGKKLKESGNSKQVLRELSIQKGLSGCPHVVQLLDVLQRDDERVLMVLEYLPLNLREYMSAFCCPHRSHAINQLRHTLLPLPHIRAILRGIFVALTALHEKGVAHRDVKPENILVEPLGAAAPLRCLCPESSSGRCCVHGTHLGHQVRIRSAAATVAVPFHHEMDSDTARYAVAMLHCAACATRCEPSSPHAGGDKEAEAAAPSPAASASFSPVPLVKLGDFGSARSVADVKLLPVEERLSSLTGAPTTPAYCAPEMLLLAPYDEAVDVWAVGALTFELVTGNMLIPFGRLYGIAPDDARPYDYTTAHRLMKLIFTLGTPTPEEWRAICPDGEAAEEARRALPQVPTSILFDSGSGGDGGQGEETLAAALRRLMTADGIDLLRQMLQYDPRRRITAQAALQHPFLNS